MARTLVETKFYAPGPRSRLVARSHLADRLDSGARGRLTLVSAPAGFGKTTLLADWASRAASGGRTVAWLSLDPQDNAADTFWAYVAASVHRVVPEAGRAVALLEEPQTPAIESVLAALINALEKIQGHITLVLDDYHVIDAPDIQEQMAFLVGRLPPNAHVALATRADPSFPLARLRARGELTEVRVADLRFTPDEAGTYLNEVAELGLSAADVKVLEERTEGWIAALQLAALSIRDRDDVEGFIAGFAGNDRFVVDYLVEEVLQRQTDEVRSFLLETSVLERLTGALCDAVTGREDGQATLEGLERGNLFVIPLDAKRHWYRYHHLLGDVLRARLLDERPEDLPDLHRRAAAWLERSGNREDAVPHAVAGEDWDQAATLVELALADMRRTRQDTTIRRWLSALPPEVLRVRPVLGIGYVGALMANGEVHEIDGFLADAERWLDPTTTDRSDMIVVDEEAFRHLPAAIAMYRAAQAQIRGDREGTLAHARRGLDLAGDEDPLGRGGAAGFLALAHWADGDLEAAHAYWADAAASLDGAGHAVDALAITRALGEIRAAQGRLREARRTYERGLERATAQGRVALRGAADMHTGLAELSLESGGVDTAIEHLLASADLDEQGLGLPQNASRRRVVASLIRAVEGDAAAAIGLLDDAERAFVGEYFPVVRPIPALRARMHLALGRLTDAAAWAEHCGVSIDDDLGYLHEFEHVTLARLLLARAETNAAVALLERLLAAAEAGGRGRTLVEVLVLLAIGRRVQGDQAAALAALRRALTLAESEGYVRTFLAEGPPMTSLLEAAVAHGISPTYAQRLLAVGDRPRRQPLADPLSERELEVLRLLATELSGPDMARELVVGLSTVRSHTKSIYGKLGVNSRRAAVRRAEELGLLGRVSR